MAYATKVLAGLKKKKLINAPASRTLPDIVLHMKNWLPKKDGLHQRLLRAACPGSVVAA